MKSLLLLIAATAIAATGASAIAQSSRSSGSGGGAFEPVGKNVSAQAATVAPTPLSNKADVSAHAALMVRSTGKNGLGPAMLNQEMPK